MDWADAIASEGVTRKGPPCAIGVARASLDPGDLAQFDGLLDDVRNGRKTGAAVTRIFNRVGIAVKVDRVLRHTRGDCLCDR